MPTALRNATEILAPIDNFRTLARKTKGELLQPLVGYNAQNARFSDEYGSITKRNSRAKYGGMSTLGTSRVIFADRYYKNSDSTKTQIIAYSTFLKKGNDSTGAFTNIKTGLTTSLRWKSLTFKDLWYGCNGTNTNQVYTGSACEDMGVPIPTAPSGVDSGVVGNPNGAYKYKVTYLIDSYQEGTASSASDTVTVSSKKITVTIPVSTNTRVTHRYLYRTAASGSIYYFCAEIANNTDTAYTDNIADASLDTTITAPTDYGAPSTFKYMCLHKSRIFGLRISDNLSRVIYSDIRSGASYPDVFPSANYFDVIKDNGEDGTFIGEDNLGNLIVLKPSALVKINTDTDDPVGWSGFTNVLSTNGCVAPYSAVKTPAGIFYITRYAERKKMLMLWDGEKSQPVFEELEPILSSVVESRLADMVGHYHNGCYHLAYTDPDSGNDYNDRELIIDLISGSWVIDKKNIDCFCSWAVGTDNGELYTGTSDATGFLYWEDVTSGDATLAESTIELIYVSQWLDFGWVHAYLKRVRKQFYQVRVDFERDTASGNLYFGYYLDGSTTITEKAFALSTYASKGYFIYQFPITTFAKMIKFRLFHDDDTASLKIKGVSFLFSPEPRGDTF